ncbi:MAG: hypothetical protein H6605_11160 [Flavobacteriales bacterium]|nr:hypothetical protein [Flavobacteriales bacterium]
MEIKMLAQETVMETVMEIMLSVLDSMKKDNKEIFKKNIHKVKPKELLNLMVNSSRMPSDIELCN